MSGTGDDDDGHPRLVVLVKHPVTGKYATLNESHLNMDHPEVQEKIASISEPD